jgi:hypothetical protein
MSGVCVCVCVCVGDSGGGGRVAVVEGEDGGCLGGACVCVCVCVLSKVVCLRTRLLPALLRR